MVNGPFIRVFILAGLVQHSSTASKEIKQQDNEAVDDSDSSVSCYTCVNVSDNSMCNEFAIDHPCPKGENFCHTLHIMDSTGASVVVNKKCADSSECWPLGVGCVLIDKQTVCVSCCDEMYCNVTVPTNKTTATYSNKRTQSQRPVVSTRSRNSSAQQLKQTILVNVAVLLKFIVMFAL